jgi:hypothetical protein
MFRRSAPLRRRTQFQLISSIISLPIWMSMVFAAPVALVICSAAPVSWWQWIPPFAMFAPFAFLPCLGIPATIREFRRRSKPPDPQESRARPGAPSAYWNALVGIDRDVPVSKVDRKMIAEMFSIGERDSIRMKLRSLGYEICVECGYWMRGLGDRSRCPECGAAVPQHQTSSPNP